MPISFKILKIAHIHQYEDKVCKNDHEKSTKALQKGIQNSHD